MNLIVRPLFCFLACNFTVPILPIAPISSDAWGQVSSRSGGVASRIVSRSTAAVGRISPTAGAILGRSVSGGVRSSVSTIGSAVGSTLGTVGSTVGAVGQSTPVGAPLLAAGQPVSRVTPSLLPLFSKPGSPATGGSTWSRTVFQSLMRPRTAAGSLGSGTAGSGNGASSPAETAEGADQSILMVAGFGGAWTSVTLRPRQSTPDNPFFGPPPLPSGGSSISAGGRARTLAECEALWDATTHMSKGEWRNSCRRTLVDPHI